MIQSMFDSRIEPPRRGVVSEPERGFAGWVHEGGGAMEQHETECLGRLSTRNVVCLRDRRRRSAPVSI